MALVADDGWSLLASAHVPISVRREFSAGTGCVMDGALGEMLPLNVATVTSTASESPRDQVTHLAVADCNIMLSSDSLETILAV